MAPYPNDFPPSDHLRALCHFALGQTDTAAQQLRAAHKAYPNYLKALWPEVLDAPPEDDRTVQPLGSEQEAWNHRADCRVVWLRTGALQWARDLKLPEPKVRAAKKPVLPKTTKAPSQAATPSLPKPAKKSSAAPRPKATAAPAPSIRSAVPKTGFGAAQEQLLRQSFVDYPRLHGLLQAVAWSPSLLMPSAWMTPVMAMDMQGNTATSMGTQLEATMELYNHLNALVLNTPAAEPAPVHEVMQLVAAGQAQAFAWAAGFVQGAALSSAAWARLGHKLHGGVGPLAQLNALAARAKTTPNGWRAVQDSGQPVLVGLSENAEPAHALLEQALSELWRVVGPLRQGGR